MVCGRGWDGCDESPEGEPLPADVNSVHEVRCCRDCVNDGPCNRSWKQQCTWFDEEVYGKSKINRSCVATTFYDAIDKCESIGGRLCTATEVLEECVRGTGCSFDNEMVWTCTYDEGECEFDVECCSGWCEDGFCEPHLF